MGLERFNPFRGLREVNRRATVLADLGFEPTMRERCPFDLERWRPGSVYRRGEERVCITCLSSWNIDRFEHLDELGFIPMYDDLNHLHYNPKTLEEIGAKLYPDGFSLKPPGQIVPT
jgi:hypothetical protein